MKKMEVEVKMKAVFHRATKLASSLVEGKSFLQMNTRDSIL